MMRSAALLAILVLACARGWAQEDAEWRNWRGPAQNGSRETGSYPAKWDVAAALWTAELPDKGCSTPVVANRRIYLTAPVDGKDAVVAFDWNGKPLWQTAFGPEAAPKHAASSGCNPSAVTDGEGVFAYFKSGTLAAVETDGKLRWQTNIQERFGKLVMVWDVGTSPVLTQRDVVVAVMHHGDSYLVAFDKRTGNLHWKTARQYETPTEGDNSYTTPIVFQYQGREALLTWGAEHVTIHDAADGKLLWTASGFNPEGRPNWPSVADAVLAGSTAVVPFGRGGYLCGVKIAGTGDVGETTRLWTRSGIGAYSPTPAEYRGRVYLLTDRGAIECIDPMTGKADWAAQLPKSNRAYYASPTLADGKLYAVREDGTAFVARVEGGFELLAEIPFGERIIATPVPVAGRLLFRGEKRLFCIGGR